ncbi:Wzz/FepE/Etk N-terminal domain-containing protein, partial [Patulibacter sp. S7RM1-6]
MTDASTPAAPDDGGAWPLGRALRRWWWLVVLVALVAGGVAAVAATQRSPSYEAEAQIFVQPYAGDDSNLLGVQVLQATNDAARDVETAAALLRSAAAEQATAR